MDEFTRNIKYDLVLVCGAYKTGTSLVTHLLEQKGYFNPAKVNNQDERGNGLSQRYLTNECAAARKINKEFLYSAHVSNFDDILTPSNPKFYFRYNHFYAIRKYIAELPSGAVIKDPQFTYTLYLWLEACWLLNKKVKVYFTDRAKNDLIAAWNEAYFTKSLLVKNKSALANMTRMSGLHQVVCSKINIPFETFSLGNLKLAINSKTL